MKAYIKVAKALGDPTRVKTLKMLEIKEMCVCEVQAALGLAQSTVSKHLKVLEEAGLVEWRRVGPWVHYCLALRDESAAGRQLVLLAQSLNDAPEVLAIREAAKKANRCQILAQPSAQAANG